MLQGICANSGQRGEQLGHRGRSGQRVPAAPTKSIVELRAEDRAFVGARGCLSNLDNVSPLRRSRQHRVPQPCGSGLVADERGMEAIDV